MGETNWEKLKKSGEFIGKNENEFFIFKGRHFFEKSGDSP